MQHFPQRLAAWLLCSSISTVRTIQIKKEIMKPRSNRKQRQRGSASNIYDFLQWITKDDNRKNVGNQAHRLSLYALKTTKYHHCVALKNSRGRWSFLVKCPFNPERNPGDKKTIGDAQKDGDKPDFTHHDKLRYLSSWDVSRRTHATAANLQLY